MTAQEQAPTAGSNPVPPKPVQQPPAARPGPEDSDDEGDQGVGKVVVPGVIGVVVGMASTVIAEKTTGLISGKTNTDAAAIFQKVSEVLPGNPHCSSVKDISIQIPEALANAKSAQANTSTEMVTLRQANTDLKNQIAKLPQADVNLEDVRRVIRKLGAQFNHADDYGTLLKEMRAEFPQHGPGVNWFSQFGSAADSIKKKCLDPVRISELTGKLYGKMSHNIPDAEQKELEKELKELRGY